VHVNHIYIYSAPSTPDDPDASGGSRADLAAHAAAPGREREFSILDSDAPGLQSIPADHRLNSSKVWKEGFRGGQFH
jgi:hypothetical protein